MREKHSGPLSCQTLLGGLIVTVVGGVIVAFLVGEGRFRLPLAPPNINFAPKVSSNAAPDTAEPVATATRAKLSVGSRMHTPTASTTDTPTTTALGSPTPANAIYGQVRWNDQPVADHPIEIMLGADCEGSIVGSTKSDKSGNYRFLVP